MKGISDDAYATTLLFASQTFSGEDLSWEENVDFNTLVSDPSFQVLYNENYHAIVKTPDGKIYNIDILKKQITLVRDTVNMKFKTGDIVLVSLEDEYAEIVNLKKDEDWGNHQYDVDFFKDGGRNTFCRDEYQLSQV